jgi:hypothetical protein
MEKQLQQLQSENTVLKAQIYDLNMALRESDMRVSDMANELMKICDIQPTEESITIQEIFNQLKAKLAPVEEKTE